MPVIVCANRAFPYWVTGVVALFKGEGLNSLPLRKCPASCPKMCAGSSSVGKQFPNLTGCDLSVTITDQFRVLTLIYAMKVSHAM